MEQSYERRTAQVSRGKWSQDAKPDGYAERAELAARIEDAMARLHSAQAELGIVSQLVRQIEIGQKR